MDWSECFKIKVYRRAMAKVASRPASGEVSVSAPDSYNNDFFKLGLLDKAAPDHWAFLFRELLPDGVRGLSFDGVKPGETGLDHAISNTELRKYALQALYYYNGFEFRYNSPIWFLISTTLRIPKIQVAWYWSVQALYNRRRLARRDHIRVLRVFLENSVAQESYVTGPNGLMAALYGTRSFNHPNCDASFNYYDLVLGSLAETGDLQRTQGGYKLTGKGLTTLDQYEQEERRHEDNRRVQWILAGLTAVVGLIALIQVFVTIWEEMNPDPAPAPFQQPVYPISPPKF
ncbi:hypothetical protein [Rhizobiales bacterium 3FA27D7]|jgi:hypothetical protein|uniref:hypothetical protein n=1 Tax=Mesorhizobium sp. 2RAF21 TaxID=3232995 RepID=UPI0010F44B3C